MDLNNKIKKSQEIILEAARKWPAQEIAVAWTGGKDSTIILHIIRTLYNDKIPFKVFFNDSTIEFPEVYDFIKKTKKDWNIDLLWEKHLQEDLEAYDATESKEDKMEIMRIAKINAINYSLSKYNIKVFMSGIRWDEHEARSDEQYFSERATHTRVHPILQFTLADIWEYIKTYNVPYVPLYDKGYKSLGEAPFTHKSKGKNASERSGREATKEKAMKRLRNLGYW